jgi:hypothetical protein
MKFSVIIPAYNAERYIRQAVDSALAQTCRDREIIVVNDGSTDSTPRILENLSGVRVISQLNMGLSAARNVGIEAAMGEFVAFLDADDWWTPDHLACVEQHLALNPAAGWIGTAWREASEEGDTIRPVKPFTRTGSRTYLPAASYRNILLPSATVVRKDLLDKAGRFPPDVRTSAEDKILWARLALVCPECLFIACCTAFYRLHGQSITRKMGESPDRPVVEYDRFTRQMAVVASTGQRGVQRFRRGMAVRCLARVLRAGDAELERRWGAEFASYLPGGWFVRRIPFHRWPRFRASAAWVVAAYLDARNHIEGRTG